MEMPYADPEKQRAAVAASKRRRYQAVGRKGKAFRKAEAERKKAWKEANPEVAAESNRASVKAWRENHPEAYREMNRERMRRVRAARKAAEQTAKSPKIPRSRRGRGPARPAGVA